MWKLIIILLFSLNLIQCLKEEKNGIKFSLRFHTKSSPNPRKTSFKFTMLSDWAITPITRQRKFNVTTSKKPCHTKLKKCISSKNITTTKSKGPIRKITTLMKTVTPRKGATGKKITLLNKNSAIRIAENMNKIMNLKNHITLLKDTTTKINSLPPKTTISPCKNNSKQCMTSKMKANFIKLSTKSTTVGTTTKHATKPKARMKGQAIKNTFLRINGNDEENYQLDKNYPYVVDIYRVYDENSTESVCTGSLINTNWVISAAACYNPGTMIITVGLSKFVYNSNTFKTVLEKILNPNQKHLISPKNNSVMKNILLLLIETVQIKPDYYAKLSALDYKTILGLPVVFTAFGVKCKDHATKLKECRRSVHQCLFYDKIMQKANLLAIKCDSTEFSPVVCLAHQCGKRFVVFDPDDTGGPVHLDGKVIGVLSTPYVSSKANFVPVSPYLDWIKDVTSIIPTKREEKELKYMVYHSDSHFKQSLANNACSEK